MLSLCITISHSLFANYCKPTARGSAHPIVEWTIDTTRSLFSDRNALLRWWDSLRSILSRVHFIGQRDMFNYNAVESSITTIREDYVLTRHSRPTSAWITWIIEPLIQTERDVAIFDKAQRLLTGIQHRIFDRLFWRYWLRHITRCYALSAKRCDHCGCLFM